MKCDCGREKKAMWVTWDDGECTEEELCPVCDFDDRAKKFFDDLIGKAPVSSISIDNKTVSNILTDNKFLGCDVHVGSPSPVPGNALYISDDALYCRIDNVWVKVEKI